MSKRPIPVKPKLEKIDPDKSDYKDTLSDDSSESSGKKSKKKLISFLLMIMIACCAGGYGYIEYKKKKDVESEEVVAAGDGEPTDSMKDADPDEADDTDININTEAVTIDGNKAEEEDAQVVAFVDDDNEPEKLDLASETETQEINFDSTPDEKSDGLDEAKITEELDGELELDLDLEPDTAKTEEPVADEPLFSISEDEKLDDENFEISAKETKTVETESDEFEALDFNSENSDTESDKFLPPKETKPVEKVQPKRKTQQPKKQSRNTQQRQSRSKRKVAKRPPALNSGQSTSQKTRRQTSSRTTTRKQKKTSNAEKVLKPIGNNDYQSPAGLIYGSGSREGHRITHVLKHAKDQPDRSGKHGVFKAKNPDELFLLIDEAYEIAKTYEVAKKRGPPVQIKKDRNRTVYTVDMKRKVGYIGGQVGKKRNHPAAYKIRFVLEEKRVITAFPM